MLGNFKVGIIYSLLLRIKYFIISPNAFIINKNASYGMTDKQIGFKLNGINNINYLKDEYNDFSGIINSFIVKYDMDKINFIEILYIIISDRPKLKSYNINQLLLNREFVNIKKLEIILALNIYFW